MKLLVLFNLIAFSQAAVLDKNNFLRKETVLELAETDPIAPYSFSYVAEATDGRSSREETSDGSGVVRGSYQISTAEGIKRTVNYIADKDGFRAQVQTNEPGTESQNPAGVQFDSSQPPAEEIALKYGQRPVERFPEVGIFHQNVLKQFPKHVGFGSVVGSTFQKSSFETPVLKQFETNVPGFSHEFLPSVQTHLTPIETPIRLLTKLQAPKFSPIFSTNFRPLGLQQNFNFETQQRELVQNRDVFN